MLHETLSPTKSADGQTTLFTFPLGNGAIPFIHLDDFARYTSFILSSRPTEVAGRELRVATTHASGPEIAQAFTRTTGKPARYVDIPIDTWLGAVFGQHPRRGADLPVGRRAYPSPMSPGQKRFFLPKTFCREFQSLVERLPKFSRREHRDHQTGLCAAGCDIARSRPQRGRVDAEGWVRRIEEGGVEGFE